MRKLLLSGLFLLCCCLSFSQQKTLTAHKTVQSPKIDGDLSDAVWQSIPPATDFLQNFPNPGSPATKKTEVRIAYDDKAIYVAAYLFDQPSLIRKQITARDEEQQSDIDYFSVLFDTYNDKQNGFQFLVTSMNVQTDARLGPNLGGGFNSFGDKNWDAVWDSKVSMKEDGWVVEMMIPYSTLRFSKKDVQDWGVQLLRFSRRDNESAYWNYVDPKVNGFVNQFGLMTGLQNLQPPLRLSFSPYVSTGVRNTPQPGGGDKTEWLRSGGMDVKYGVNESFTLDATLIPDFGQVVSDNVVNNLTPFEVRFTENRPFFTEGTEIFNKAGLFYSRRIGATPSRYYYVKDLAQNDPDIEIRKNPTITQLYNAIKFSGRTRKKLGIGIFNAVTAPMHAVIKEQQTGEQTRIETEPLTNYNIVVLDQALKGRSFVTLTNTNVLRNGHYRDANVTSFDYSFYDKKNMFNVRGTGRYSKIFSANPYDGFATTLRVGKVSGQWQYQATANVESDRYNPRDLGFLQSPNEITYTGNVTYNQFDPTKNFLSYFYNLNFRYNRLYKPNAFGEMFLEARGFWFFKNFWDVSLTLGSNLKNSHDYFVLNQPTTGLFVQRPAFSFAEVSGSTDSRKKLFLRYSFLLGGFNVGDKKYHVTDLGLRYRFSNRLSVEVSNRYEVEANYIINPDTVSVRPLIAFVDFDDVTTVLSGIYHFAPRVNLTLRARHYWSKVIHNTLANVDGKGRDINRTPAPAYLNQNENVFNVDAFFTWDFRLGSRLILGYKNWIGEDERVSGVKNASYARNFGRVFGLRHGNELTARFIYFLDYNQLRKKH